MEHQQGWILGVLAALAIPMRVSVPCQMELVIGKADEGVWCHILGHRHILHSGGCQHNGTCMSAGVHIRSCVCVVLAERLTQNDVL